jgi:hypothetical protein
VGTALIAAAAGFTPRIEVPQASILLTDSTSISRRPPVSNKPAQQPLAVNRFFKGRGLKLRAW